MKGMREFLHRFGRPLDWSDHHLLMLTEEKCRRLDLLVCFLHVHLSLLHQLEPKFLSFLHRDRKVLHIFHYLIHDFFRQLLKPLAISDLRTPPIPLLRRHVGSRDDTAMRVDQKQCQYLSVSWLRRVFELEWRHSVLEDVREGKKPPLSRDDSA